MIILKWIQPLFAWEKTGILMKIKKGEDKYSYTAAIIKRILDLSQTFLWDKYTHSHTRDNSFYF